MPFIMPFPRTLRQYVNSWRNENEASLEAAERKLLSFELNLDEHGDSDKPSARLFKVPMPEYDGYMNTLELGNGQNKTSAKHAIVLVHGFGAGLALFNKHLPSLAEHVSDDTRCLALDLLGMARSSRIRCPVDAKTKKGRADQAEAFFVKSLEAWRLALGIERITFIAHSLGAYFASAYTLSHREVVVKLVLAGAAGMVDPSLDPDGGLSNHIKRNPKDVGLVYSALHALWKLRLTPLDVIRPLGLIGAIATAKYVEDHILRESDETEEYMSCLYSYLYGLSFVCPAGSDNALFHILAAGARPDFPMLQRFAGFDTNHCSLHFIYGDSDWIAQVNQKHAESLGLEVSVQNIPHAGHLLYVDNPEGFDNAVRDALRR